MFILRRITKSTNTHLEYIKIFLYGNNHYSNEPRSYVYTFACLVTVNKCYSLPVNFIYEHYCLFRVLCCGIVEPVAQTNGLSWTANGRMLAGCKHHKIFSFISFYLHSNYNRPDLKVGTRTPPREYKVCWSQETLNVFRLYEKMDNQAEATSNLLYQLL